MFTIEAYHNHQNDRIWAQKSPLSKKIVSHSQHPQSAMVWAGICASDKTPLVFVEPWVKISKNYYLKEILQRFWSLGPWARAHFGNRDWIFQQDSAPAHKAREVQNWCQAIFPGFITSQEWPLTLQIWTRRIFLSELFWRQGHVLCLTKIWIPFLNLDSLLKKINLVNLKFFKI